MSAPPSRLYCNSVSFFLLLFFINTFVYFFICFFYILLFFVNFFFSNFYICLFSIIYEVFFSAMSSPPSILYRNSVSFFQLLLYLNNLHCYLSCFYWIILLFGKLLLLS